MEGLIGGFLWQRRYTSTAFDGNVDVRSMVLKEVLENEVYCYVIHVLQSHQFFFTPNVSGFFDVWKAGGEETVAGCYWTGGGEGAEGVAGFAGARDGAEGVV